MVSRREFDELHYQHMGYLSDLVPPLEDQADTARWYEKLAHIDRQIPPFTQATLEGSGGNGFKGISTVDGVTWSWHIIPEPFQHFHPYIDTGGKKAFQKEWAFLTFVTPMRTDDERSKAQTFATEYGHALRCIMIQRANTAQNLLSQRRG